MIMTFAPAFSNYGNVVNKKFPHDASKNKTTRHVNSDKRNKMRCNSGSVIRIIIIPQALPPQLLLRINMISGKQ